MKTYRQIVDCLRQVYAGGEARALARWLCEERFGLSQTDILLDKDNDLSAEDLENLKEITSRLVHHEPIQYILGHTTFCDRRFFVAPGALIPRPETEELVRLILASRGDKMSAPRILDVGTGTACIAISLSLGLPQSEVTAWDISREALDVARRNVASYPDCHVFLECSDIFAPPNDDRQWELIVSNPPYVRQSEASGMERNVLDYEPHLALFVPDNDPLLYYRAITDYATTHLTDGGELWFEINHSFSAELSHLIEGKGFREVHVFEDAFGHPRFFSGLKL